MTEFENMETTMEMEEPVSEEKKGFEMPEVTPEGVGLLGGAVALGVGLGVGAHELWIKHKEKKAAKAATPSGEKKPGVLQRISDKIPFTLKKKADPEPEVVEPEVIKPAETTKKSKK